MTYISIFAALAFACGIIAADIVPVPADWPEQGSACPLCGP